MAYDIFNSSPADGVAGNASRFIRQVAAVFSTQV